MSAIRVGEVLVHVRMLKGLRNSDGPKLRGDRSDRGPQDSVLTATLGTVGASLSCKAGTR